MIRAEILTRWLVEDTGLQMVFPKAEDLPEGVELPTQEQWDTAVANARKFFVPAIEIEYPYTEDNERLWESAGQENQIPEPNQTTVIVERTEATMELIRNDPNYYILSEVTL